MQLKKVPAILSSFTPLLDSWLCLSSAVGIGRGGGKSFQRLVTDSHCFLQGEDGKLIDQWYVIDQFSIYRANV